MELELGQKIMTPRFCTVTISAMFADPKAARQAGYTEGSGYVSPDWEILGKPAGLNRMVFAAIKKY